MDDKTRTELEAATFRRLVQHLRERTDVQNIDLMNLAGFCRNCLSKWYLAAAQDQGVEAHHLSAGGAAHASGHERVYPAEKPAVGLTGATAALEGVKTHAPHSMCKHFTEQLLQQRRDTPLRRLNRPSVCR